jgi:hypothetical protein
LWQPEDWPFPEYGDPASISCESTCAHALRRLLAGVPGDLSSIAVSLGGVSGELHACLIERFPRVVCLDAVVGALEPHPSRFDVAVAIDCLGGGDTAGLLDATRRSLVEGGIVLATLPAVPQSDTPFDMCLGRDRAVLGEARFHEVELQYLLYRVGFQGVRIRRVFDEWTDDRLLFMAVRRANN